MSDHDDFALELEEDRPAASAPPDPPVKVVIEYRTRGVPSFLVPPILILLMALAILSYRRQTPIPALASVPSPGGPSAEGAKGGEAPASRAKPEPIVVRALPAPTPAPPVDPPAPAAPEVVVHPAPDVPPPPGQAKPAEGTAKGPLSPYALAAADAALDVDLRPRRENAAAPPPPAPVAPPDAGRDPAVAVVVPPRPQPAGPADPPEVTKEEAMEEILREAAEKGAKKAANDRRLERWMAQAHIRELAELARKAQERRVPFHRDLREALKRYGRNAGPQIESLCDHYGRTAPDDIKKIVAIKLKRSHARLGRQSQIEMMRDCGYPETNILEYLANQIARDQGGRGGPRNGNQVWVQAARVLLTMPPRDAKPAPSAPQNAPKPAARAGATPVRGLARQAQ